METSPGRAFAAGLEIRYVKTLLSRCNSAFQPRDWSRRLTAIGDASPPRHLKRDRPGWAVTATLRRSRPTPAGPFRVLAMPLPGTLTVDTMATMVEERS